MGAELLAELRSAGFAVRLDGGQLVVAPRSELDEERRRRIRECRDDLISALADETPIDAGLADAINRTCALRGDEPDNRLALLHECSGLVRAEQADWRRYFEDQVRLLEGGP